MADFTNEFPVLVELVKPGSCAASKFTRSPDRVRERSVTRVYKYVPLRIRRHTDRFAHDDVVRQFQKVGRRINGISGTEVWANSGAVIKISTATKSTFEKRRM